MKLIKKIYEKMKKRFEEGSIRRLAFNPFIMAESVFATPLSPEEKARLQKQIDEL